MDDKGQGELTISALLRRTTSTTHHATHMSTEHAVISRLGLGAVYTSLDGASRDEMADGQQRAV